MTLAEINLAGVLRSFLEALENQRGFTPERIDQLFREAEEAIGRYKISKSGDRWSIDNSYEDIRDLIEAE